jgi:hypothetical protein
MFRDADQGCLIFFLSDLHHDLNHFKKINGFDLFENLDFIHDFFKIWL